LLQHRLTGPDVKLRVALIVRPERCDESAEGEL